ncbi:flavin reductase family protein [Streptomyces luteogriseus]|uniref:flavin reductase family protein n=1 Tax=Streptomyces luteogriseus TaxID=68233 RepID=UPI00378A1DA2
MPREKDGRGGSACVHDKLAPGDRITLRGPRNNFAFVPARPYVFVAGGIGITPFLSMISAAEVAGVEWSLDYGGHDLGSMAFATDPPARYARVRPHPQDEVGLIGLTTVCGYGRTSRSSPWWRWPASAFRPPAAVATCGTCETEVIEGEVDHRDELLTEEERTAHKVMFVCASRANCPKVALRL